MEKINFEDATLKKSAYVTIDGTEYPVTDAEYEGGTDLDAETLNYAFKLMHPVGSVYISTSSANPADIFGFGTWEACCVGKFPLGVDENEPTIGLSGLTGGEKEHTLTLAEMPKHTHSLKTGAKTNAWEEPNYVIAYQYQSASALVSSEGIETAGSGQSHNNMPPYETFYFWKRTA